MSGFCSVPIRYDDTKRSEADQLLNALTLSGAILELCAGLGNCHSFQVSDDEGEY